MRRANRVVVDVGAGADEGYVHQPCQRDANHFARIARKALSAACTVASISSSPCAIDMNPASNCDGAKYTPCSSMARKNAAYCFVSAVLAVAPLTTGRTVKKAVNIVPTR